MSIPLILVAMSAALTGLYFGSQVAGRAQMPAGEIAVAEHVKTSPHYAVPDVLVFPMQNEKGLAGYFVARIAVSLDQAAPLVTVLPDDVVLADAFYAAIFSLRAPVEQTDKVPDPGTIAEQLLAHANSGSGKLRFEQVFLQQFDVFEPEGLRRKNVRERNVEPTAEEAKKPAEKPKSQEH